jgi:hypothetical protein
MNIIEIEMECGYGGVNELKAIIIIIETIGSHGTKYL